MGIQKPLKMLFIYRYWLRKKHSNITFESLMHIYSLQIA